MFYGTQAVHGLTVTSAGATRQGILDGRRSCVETIIDALERADQVQDDCNAFTILLHDEALERARDLDTARTSGTKPGSLFGVPIAIKDMTPTKGHPTTLGSWTSGEGITDHDAIIVERLKRAGAIPIGKTTTAEFAFSSFTRSPRYGATLNPWNPERTAGGSSGGSATAVAAGVVPLAEGTDMGGSVRIPAAACGIVGFKPSLGRIPMTILPIGLETISHFGPLARCVEDAVLFVAATAGHHPADMLSQPGRFQIDQTHTQSLKGKRFALSMDLGYCEVHPDVSAAIVETVDRMRDAGAIIEEVGLPWTRDVFDQWAKRWNCLLGLFPNCSSEADLARMDPALVTCIRDGRRLSAVDLLQVDIVRTGMNADLTALFSRFDALLCPTNAIPAPPLTDSDADYEMDLENGKLRAFDMAHPFNMVPTCPVISLPVGLSTDCMPIGMQVVGPAHADEAVLALARHVEQLTEPLPTPPIYCCPSLRSTTE